MQFRGRVRVTVRITFSVWLVSGYAHVCIQLSVGIEMDKIRRWMVGRLVDLRILGKEMSEYNRSKFCSRPICVVMAAVGINCGRPGPFPNGYFVGGQNTLVGSIIEFRSA